MTRNYCELYLSLIKDRNIKLGSVLEIPHYYCHITTSEYIVVTSIKSGCLYGKGASYYVNNDNDTIFYPSASEEKEITARTLYLAEVVGEIEECADDRTTLSYISKLEELTNLAVGDYYLFYDFYLYVVSYDRCVLVPKDKEFDFNTLIRGKLDNYIEPLMEIDKLGNDMVFVTKLKLFR